MTRDGKPWLLDLYCGAGGATRGYQQAGFNVVGVDVVDQPNYCGEEFVKADALAFLEAQGHELSPASFDLGDPRPFAAIHASPPCQFASAVTPDKSLHRNFIPETRRLLKMSGLPYVIENVMGAREHLHDPVMLCGSSFGLTLLRHRLFETSFPVMAPPCAHGQLKAQFDVYEHGKWRKSVAPAIYGSGGRKAREHWASALGIDWMSHDEMALAIPPAMTEHIGHYLMSAIESEVAA